VCMICICKRRKLRNRNLNAVMSILQLPTTKLERQARSTFSQAEVPERKTMPAEEKRAHVFVHVSGSRAKSQPERQFSEACSH